jgi:hypothetical protein
LSAAIAEKSFVNDAVEMLGADPELLVDEPVPVDAAAAVDELELELGLELVFEFDDELPHAETPTLAAAISAATTALL